MQTLSATARIVQAVCVRTKMIGGGTSYDVYLPKSEKAYYPIVGHIYATVIHWEGGEYFSLSDFLRTPQMDALPSMTDERWNAFKRLERLAERLEAKIAARAYPELAGAKKLPFLWASWTLPSEQVSVPVILKDRDNEGGEL